MSDQDPTGVANQILDAIGWPITLGDIEDGSREAQILLRAYGQSLRQLLRAANWAFARTEAPLLLLADATGNTPDVGTIVQQPWCYCYAYPTDAMKIRFIPASLYNQADTVPANNIQIPSTPLVTGIGQQPPPGLRIQPAKFVVATDYNYPPPAGSETWQTQGTSPNGRTVILTNVRHATAVYTSLVLYPSLWDSLFRAALVAYVASEVALAMWAKTDRKFGMEVRAQQIAIVKAKVTEARLTDANESVSTSDVSVDWVRARRVGGTWNGWGGGMGYGGGGAMIGGYESLALADGAVF